MNRKLFITLGLIIAILSCNKDKNEVTPSTDGSANESAARGGSLSGERYEATATSEKSTHPTYYSDRTIGGGGTTTTTSTFIAKDVANEMLNSYLYSMSHDHDYDAGAPALHSYSIDADSLRALLADPSVKNVKVMFGHTMDYISAGYYGRYAGFRTGALTLIIVGYDASGNYVYLGGKVLDHAMPCPYSCPPGTAASNLLE